MGIRFIGLDGIGRLFYSRSDFKLTWEQIQEENHDKHFRYTLFLIWGLTPLVMHFTHLYGIPWYEYAMIAVLSGGFGWSINAIREMYHSGRRKDIPYSYRDVRFGGYGGLIGGIAGVLTFIMVNNFLS